MHILPALCSTLGFGISNGLGRTLARIDPAMGLVLRGVSVLIFLACALCVVGVPEVHVSPKDAMMVIGIGMLGYVPIWALYRGLACADVGLVMPLAYTNPAITALLAMGVSGTSFTFFGYASMMLLFVGAFVVSFAPSARVSRVGVAYGLLAGVGWGVVFFLFQYPVHVYGPLLTACCIEACVVLCGVGEVYMRGTQSYRAALATAGVPFVLFLGAGACIGSYGFLLSTKMIGVAYSAAIGSASPVIATIVGSIWYGERVTVRTGCAVVCTMCGIAGIALG